MKAVKILLPCMLLLAIASCKKEKEAAAGAEVKQLMDVAYGSEPAQKMDVYLPAGRSTSSTKVLLLAHGGAWVSGDKTEFTSFIDTLKRRLPQYAIFNINYRLSDIPNNLFSTQETDIKNAVSFIYQRREEYGIADKFAFAGVSAGAHLAMLHAYKYSSPVKIKAVIDFFGPTDLLDLFNNPGVIPRDYFEKIIGATPEDNPEIYFQSSPVNFIDPQSSPTLILQGSADPLVNAGRQSAVLHNKLNTNGVASEYVVYPRKGHGDDWDNATFYNAFERIERFLAAHNP